MSADLALEVAFSHLRDSTSKPSGLGVDNIRLSELLPSEMEELPLVGVYLVDDRPLEQVAEGISNREVEIQVEIRALIADGQDTLAATKALRAWVCREILPNQTRETGIEGAEFTNFKPFGLSGLERMAGALLIFTIPYFFDPEED